MTIATGVAKSVAYKAETTWATAAGASGATYLRRVSCDLDQTKGVYESQEIRTDYQIADSRDGVKMAKGTLKGELSPGSYSALMAAALRKAFVAVSALTSLSITIAAGSTVNGVQEYTVTRASGSFLTDGLKIGNVIRLTAGSFTAGNLNNNLLIVALTATVATVIVLNGSSLTAEGPIASATVTMPGKKTYVPTTGHTDTSFTIEQRYSDVSQYETYLGCKVASMAIALPATGFATVDFGFMGQCRSSALSGSSAYFSSPSAASSTGLLTSNSGILIANGSPVAIVTGANLQYDGGMTAPAGVVGSNLIPAIFQGRAKFSGDFSPYFEDGTYRDLFDAETALDLMLCLTTGSANAADFMSLYLSNIKLGGASKDDGEKGLVQKVPFRALINSSGGSGTAYEQSTISIHDSQA